MPHYTRTKGVCIGTRCAEHSPGKHRTYPFAVFNVVTGETVSTHRTAEEAIAAIDNAPVFDYVDYVDTREETDANFPADRKGGLPIDYGFLMSDGPTTAQREFGDWSE